MIKFKCICCDVEKEFADGRAAFDAGWDVPPYFTLQPLCDLCPASAVVIHGLEAARQRHKASHERWEKKEGRPALFEWNEEKNLDTSKGERQ